MTFAALALAALAAGAAEPLKCPEGTTLKTRAGQGGELTEWCLDANGKRHGPQREFLADGTLGAEGINDARTGRAEAKIYNRAGALTDELKLEGRKIVYHRFTVAGLEQFLAPLNDTWKSRDPPVSFRVIDERTAGVDFHFPDADAEAGAQKLRFFEAFVRRNFCKLLTGPEEIHAIEIRVINDQKADAQMTTRVTRAMCAQQASE